MKFGQRATISVEDSDVLVIRVADEGPGIPDEFLERVFEPFYRVESSRNRDTGGTITLRNRPKGGLIAELRLPRRR